MELLAVESATLRENMGEASQHEIDRVLKYWETGANLGPNGGGEAHAAVMKACHDEMRQLTCKICRLKGHRPGSCWYWSQLYNQCRANPARRQTYAAVKAWIETKKKVAMATAKAQSIV